MSLRRKICVLSFSPVARDPRVLRHLRFLGEKFDLIALGFGPDPGPALPGVNLQWISLKAPAPNFPAKILRTLLRWPGRLISACDALPDLLTPAWRAARAALTDLDYDLFLGNDVAPLLLGVWQQARKGKPFLMDYHEYAPLEAEEKFWHRWFHGPHGYRLLKRYGPQAAGSVTVNRQFAQRFEQEFGFPAITVMNAPELVDLPPVPRRTDGRIHLVFHGNPGGDRNLDQLLRAMPLLDDRFVLHLMLMSGAEPDSLFRRLAAGAPAGRVIFEETVAPAETVSRLAAWDIGFNILQPLNYNHRHALPNKFFDYIHAGLATVCSNTVTAAEFVREHGIGWVLETITPESLAALLRSVSAGDIAGRKSAALRLRENLHAGTEESRLVQLATRILQLN